MSFINDVGTSIADAWFWFNTTRAASAAALVGVGLATVTATVAVRTLRQTRRDSRAKSRPMMTAELRPVPHSPGSQSLVIRNYGPSIAKNVRVAFDPEIPMPEDPTGLVTPFLLKRYAKPISVMTPGMELDNLYYVGRPGPDGRFANSEPVPDQVAVKIAYLSDDGDGYSDEFALDVDLLRGRTYQTSSSSPEELAKEAVKQLKQLVAFAKSVAESAALATREERERRQAELDAAWHRKQEGQEPAG